MKIRLVTVFLPLLAVSLCATPAMAQPCDSKPCKAHGLCTRNESGECGAASDQDCTGSVACKENGYCKHHQGRCIPGSDAACVKAEYCKPYGLCSFSNNACVAKSDKDCQKSDQCKTLGLCSAQDGVCVVGKNADCKPLDGCKVFGKCTAKGHGCIVGSDSDCASATVCKEQKACKRGPQYWGHFVVTGTKAPIGGDNKYESVGQNVPQAAPSLVAGEDAECMKVFKTVDYVAPKDRAAGVKKALECCVAAAKNNSKLSCTEIPNGGKHTADAIAAIKTCIEQAGFTKGRTEAFSLCRIKTQKCVAPPQPKVSPKAAEKAEPRKGK